MINSIYDSHYRHAWVESRGHFKMNSNKKQDISEKIMNAAIDLISVKGYNGVTTEEIATKAGY